MSAALINRSLTNTRTELEFLLDSEVITKDLYDLLMASLPAKYQKDMAPWGTDKVPLLPLRAPESAGADSLADQLASVMASTNIAEKEPPAKLAAISPPPRPAPVLGYCKALYDYESSEEGDLKLTKGVRIAVLEHLSPDWWKGYKQGEDKSKAGVFPANYVASIPASEFTTTHSEESVSLNEKSNEKVPLLQGTVAPPSYNHDYSPPSGAPPQGYQPQHNYASPPQGYQSPQPSYGGYSQFPPPSTNYYPPQQQQMQPQPQPQPQPEQEHHHQPSKMEGHVKSVGSKFGNAAIFGAGSALGSDLMRLIF